MGRGDLRRTPLNHPQAGGQMKELVYVDASFSTPVKAMKANRFLFTRQTFVEFPDLRVSGPGFADAKKEPAVAPVPASTDGAPTGGGRAAHGTPARMYTEP